MLSELIRIGDEVIQVLSQENRQIGDRPIYGKRAVVTGFGKIYSGRYKGAMLKPGVYVNKEDASICFADGTKASAQTFRLELVDQVEHELRSAEYRKIKATDPNYWRRGEFKSDLPNTPYWELDYVKISGFQSPVPEKNMPTWHEPGVFQVIKIEYEELGVVTTRGTKYRAYYISDYPGAGWHSSSNEDEMTLVRRGPIWRYYHNEILEFSSIAEVANFYDGIGQTVILLNPATGQCAWTKEEVLQGIRRGIVHGFSVEGGFFGAGNLIAAKRFLNEDVGMRVAKATLEGFSFAL